MLDLAWLLLIWHACQRSQPVISVPRVPSRGFHYCKATSGLTCSHGMVLILGIA